MERLDENSVFLVQDWAMKFLPKRLVCKARVTLAHHGGSKEAIRPTARVDDIRAPF